MLRARPGEAARWRCPTRRWQQVLGAQSLRVGVPGARARSEQGEDRPPDSGWVKAVCTPDLARRPQDSPPSQPRLPLALASRPSLTPPTSALTPIAGGQRWNTRASPSPRGGLRSCPFPRKARRSRADAATHRGASLALPRVPMAAALRPEPAHLARRDRLGAARRIPRLCSGLRRLPSPPGAGRSPGDPRAVRGKSAGTKFVRARSLRSRAREHSPAQPPDRLVIVSREETWGP